MSGSIPLAINSHYHRKFKKELAESLAKKEIKHTQEHMHQSMTNTWLALGCCN
jgi:hypothetical protein